MTQTSEGSSTNVLTRELGRLGTAMRDQEEKLAAGPSPENLQAASDLAELKQRAADIRARLQQLAAGQAGTDIDGKAADCTVNDIKAGIELEVRDLADAFERLRGR